MSGAPGHIQHLYEDGDLTFGELKQILQQAASGKLKQVTEKLDGMNLVFTWDLMAETGRELRVARSVGDIKHGGMGAAELAKKFYGRHNIEQAFNSAFKVLGDAINVLSPTLKFKAFGPSGQVWYSIEVVYAASPNVINYDTNAIIFHGWPVFRQHLDSVVQCEAPDVIAALTQCVDQMQKAVTLKDWRVCGPTLVNLKKLTDGTALKEALHALHCAQSCAGLDDNNTINDFLVSAISSRQEISRFAPHIQQAITARIVGLPGAPTLHDIRRMVNLTQYPAVSDFVKQGPDLIKSLMYNIELSILRFSTQVLQGIQSTLVNDADTEVLRLKTQVKLALQAIDAAGNAEASSFACAQLVRLGSTENITTTVEGVVFIYRGKAYKFTGAFSPVNQLLALIKYGRKGFKITP